jgi:putative flippase GtrA
VSEPSQEKRRGAEILRFLAGGASTTAVSYAIYLLLLTWLPYLAAYVIAYVVGIAWSYAVNTLFVFRGKPSLRRALAFPLVYLAQWIVGSLLLYVLVDEFHLPAQWGPLFVVVLTLPLTYALSRKVIAH